MTGSVGEDLAPRIVSIFDLGVASVVGQGLGGTQSVLVEPEGTAGRSPIAVRAHLSQVGVA